jgi:uncharacterized membrane protein (DUF485 family)
MAHAESSPAAAPNLSAFSAASTTAPARVQALLNDPQYLELMRQKKRISGILTALTFAMYFGFVGLLAFAPELLAAPFGSATLGIPFGIGIIILAWIFTGIYVRWANDRYDAMIAAIRAQANAVER